MRRDVGEGVRHVERRLRPQRLAVQEAAEYVLDRQDIPEPGDRRVQPHALPSIRWRRGEIDEVREPPISD